MKIVKLLKCPHCGKIYKCTQIDTKLVTDFNDEFNVINGVFICINCGKGIIIQDNVIETSDWIADRLFAVKG